jgi:phosphoglycolate phosphatase-like HAD superfamily hydrolase
VRTAGAIGGTAAVLSGIQKYSDAKNAAQEVKELATSFENEAAAQVVEVEGRSLKLTGTAEEQYREWRRLLAEIYREERAPEQPAPATAKP